VPKLLVCVADRNVRYKSGSMHVEHLPHVAVSIQHSSDFLFLSKAASPIMVSFEIM